MLKFVAGIAQGKTDLDKQFAHWTAFADKEVKAIEGDLSRIDAAVVDVARQIEKKKKKLLQSKKYKTKIGSYESTLGDVLKGVKQLKQGLKLLRPALVKKSIDEIKISTSTTLGEIDESSLIVDLKAQWKNAEKAAQSGVQERRKFRQAGDLTGARAMMQQWIKEADEMEAEAEEGEEDGGKDKQDAPDPKPKLSAIVFKIGSSVIANAKAGEYDTKAKLLVADLTWKIKGDDPLQYLQKKFKVEADFAAKGQGSFAQELKLDKLAGNLVKATFKG